MIIDLKKFIDQEKGAWEELEGMLTSLERDPDKRFEMNELKRFHYLYQRASADLSKVITFSAEPEMRKHLESLVARAFAEIHETRKKTRKIRPHIWFFVNFPRTFRKHSNAFWLAFSIMMAGVIFGGAALMFDPEAKGVIIPFPHLAGDPSDRVAEEESGVNENLAGHKASFAGQLMTHNTRVSIFSLALGVTFGIGTIILLFFNGIILGGVAADYIMAHETGFLAGWLLPHGSVEIPAILIASQAGLVLAGALLGRGREENLRARLRAISTDMVILIFGVSMLLVWAGIVESFFSQYHAPILPYSVKIIFGSIQLLAFILFMTKGGKKKNQKKTSPGVFLKKALNSD